MKIISLLVLFFSIVLTANTDSLKIFDYIDNDDYDKVIEVIQSGIDVNIQNPRFYNDTPLMSIAFKYNKPKEIHLTVAKMLLDHGADPNLSNSFGTNALVLATKLHKTDKMFMLMNGYNANLTTLFYPSKESLLHVVITNPTQGGIEIFKHLLASGLDINLQNDSGITPLMLAMDENCQKFEGCGLKNYIIRTLVDSGAKLELEDKYFGFTALKFGIDATNETYNYKYPEIEYLLQKGAIVDDECIELADDPELKLLLKKYKQDSLKPEFCIRIRV